MRRLAWFTPLAPIRSGIAQYSAEILPLLTKHYAIDVVPEAAAFDFQRKHVTEPYDLIVYQLGNASCHDYMWAYLLRYPGLVVLHDAQLHQSRALALLSRERRPDDYRAEFSYSHPDAPRQIADFVVAGCGGVLFYMWPMRRLVLAVARSVAVHNDRLARDLSEARPDGHVEVIRMGVPCQSPLVHCDELRRRHAIPTGAVVFAAFGRMTPEKRISGILRGLRSISGAVDAHLLLVGDRAEYYDPLAEARKFGIESRVTLTGFVPDAELTAYIDLADVGLCLRWPTSRETSASWLRCLAQGKPTVITDLSDTVNTTSLDPRTWTELQGEPEEARRQQGPTAISVDLLDEEHSLKLAMRRLATDPGLRRELGENAKAYWAREHTLEHMASDYRRVIENAVTCPTYRLDGAPPHVWRDGTDLARSLLDGMGVGVDLF